MKPIIHILVVGIDEAAVSELHGEWQKHGGICYGAENLMQKLPEIKANQYHLIAVFIPPGQEQEALRQIVLVRGLSAIPIIAATRAPYDPALRIRALEAGADQFHIFPIAVRERVSIGRALLRRYTELNNRDNPPVTVFFRGRLTVSVEQLVVLVDDREIELLPKEFDILCLLIQNPGRWYSVDGIYERVWNRGPAPSAKEVVRKQVYSLKKKLHPFPGLPEYIRSQRGAGYQFSPDDHHPDP